MSGLKALLRRAGKDQGKVVVAFGISPERCDHAVRYLRNGAPGLPVWLFSTGVPLPATAALCDRVIVRGNSLGLLLEAEKLLWPYWVALGVATWAGERGRWPVKLAPFLIPPFRALLINEHGGALAGTPGAVLRHAARRLRDAAHSGWNRFLDLSKAWFVVLLWLLVRVVAFRARFFFDKLHGDGALSLPPVAQSQRLGVAYFRQEGMLWRWKELEALARSSDCRWIVYVETDADSAFHDSAFEDMIALFDSEHTFAVSRQRAFRAWKKMLFPVAPFRQLQPDAATQVLAPVSNVILVDREKLLTLGIPHCTFPGTAWLMMFWRAAAAGWRSYSVGGTAKLREQPDWPNQEAEFVTRVLPDSILRRLGPREPDLSRGTIAFQARRFAPAAHQMAPHDKPRVLVVSPYLPYPLSHGGAVRIYNLCRELKNRVDLFLAAFREKDDDIEFDKLYEVFREVFVLDRDQRMLKDRTLPKQVRDHHSPSMRALIAKLCRERRIDLLQVEYTHMAGFRDAAPDTPAILVEHDLTFTLYRQLAERNANRDSEAEHRRWLAFERRWLESYDGVWTMSAQDRATAIAEGSHPGRTFTVPNGVDLSRFAPVGQVPDLPNCVGDLPAPPNRVGQSPAPPHSEIFYVGSFRHLPNILGFDKLRKEVMPEIWRRFPGAQLRVVAGPDHERYWRMFAKKERLENLDRRIQMHGFVEDLRPLYAKASVVVVPLLVSAGTNIKVMEAMACCKAVVSTSVGCTGLDLIDGHDVLIRDHWPEFASAVCKLLSEDSLRLRIAAEARQTVEARFSWTAIADRAYESYLHFTGAHAQLSEAR